MKPVSKDRLGKIFLILWIPLISIVISFQMVNHIVSMPLPDDYRKIQDRMPRLRQSKGWLMVHVIYKNCSCTNALTTSLIDRKVTPNLEEWVIYAGSDRKIQEQFEAAGFLFQAETKVSIDERYGIEAAPMLLIFSPENGLAYGGGYFERPSVFHSMDQALLRRIKEGEAVDALPLYGCAVSPRLQKLIDPLGIKFQD